MKIICESSTMFAVSLIILGLLVTSVDGKSFYKSQVRGFQAEGSASNFDDCIYESLGISLVDNSQGKKGANGEAFLSFYKDDYCKGHYSYGWLSLSKQKFSTSIKSNVEFSIDESMYLSSCTSTCDVFSGCEYSCVDTTVQVQLNFSWIPIAGTTSSGSYSYEFSYEDYMYRSRGRATSVDATFTATGWIGDEPWGSSDQYAYGYLRQVSEGTTERYY